MQKDFILASSSPQRKMLLEQIGFIPKKIQAADIDESEKKFENPTAYVKRMALEKASKVASLNPENVVLGSDTVVVVKGKVLHKSIDDTEQTKVMNMLSGKSHRVLSAICVIDKNGKTSVRVSTTKIQMKHLTSREISDYVASKEWVGCSGYKIEGLLAGFVIQMIGSYSGVIGLPLFETRNLLISAGVK